MTESEHLGQTVLSKWNTLFYLSVCFDTFYLQMKGPQLINEALRLLRNWMEADDWVSEEQGQFGEREQSNGLSL